MHGSDSKQADFLFTAIVEYFSNISGSDITAEQLRKRDTILVNLGIVCDDALDNEILALQERVIISESASTPSEGASLKKAAVEEAINLLAP